LSDGHITGDIRSSAGLKGTVVTAEELFYNTPCRRRALKYPADEMNRIADVVIRYAIHNPSVSFTMRRCGSGNDFRTTGDGDQFKVIASLHGSNAAKNLITLDREDEKLFYSLKGCMARPSASCTAPSLQSKQNRQKIFYLFINNRSVECAQLKQALDVVFAAQNTFSTFIMLSLQIAPNRIDVNVHPTKATVFFLEQDAIIASIQDYIESLIQNSSDSCSVPTITPYMGTSSAVYDGPTFIEFPTMSSTASSSSKKRYPAEVPEHLGGPPPPSSRAPLSSGSTSSFENNQSQPANASSSPATKKVYAHQLVRTDVNERRLEEFTIKSESQSLSQVEMVAADGVLNDSIASEGIMDPEWREFDFDSLKAMRKEICDNASLSLRNLFKEHTFIGTIDQNRSLIQHSTSIYLIDTKQIFMNFFYQLLVLSFGNFGSFKLSESAPIAELFLIGNEEENEENAKKYADFLVENREMLNDYFCLRITSDGAVETIPSLIDGYVPQLEGLPTLISSLVYDVDWEQEQTCFTGICWALANFFCVHEEYCKGEQLSGLDADCLPWKRVFSDLLFPALKTNFVPPESLKSRVRRLVDLYDLYKVFERC
uniref:DNA mismatch repair protein Mlh1 (inferred by orthology to a human protein) n=2 Tax=Anisakis simplex TaxID=6269 RepID=A0A0M3K5J6_ANISI